MILEVKVIIVTNIVVIELITEILMYRILYQLIFIKNI